MSWLLIDAGNSALKWSLVCGESVPQPAAVPVQGTLAIDTPSLANALAEELSRAFRMAAASAKLSAPAASWGCAVAAQDKILAIEAAIQAAGWPAICWFGAADRFDHDGIVLRNCYREARQLGADRWHALIGARARFARGCLLVVNAGTATTVDAVGEGGQFLGGVIAPGVELMRASLARGTARLPWAAGDYVAHPDNTDDAIRTGILDAQIGLITQRLQRAGEQAAGGVQVVVSGGNGPLLLALLRTQPGFGTMVLEPDLVLLGLWHRARAQIASALTDPTA